ncbi:MAG: thiamine pyrophosphate-binding protein, partial [Phycisphaerae bacterium]
REAFYVATTRRPGPVLIDVPKDVQQQYAVDQQGDYIEPDFDPPLPAAAQPTLHGSSLEQICQLIKQARRPIIYAGGGVISADASQLLLQFASKANIPVTTTLMGLGAIPHDHRLSLGVLGMHGSKYANDAINQADLIIALGVRFDDRVTGKVSEFAKQGKIVHVDIDPKEINKNKPVDVGIVADLRVILQALLERVEPSQCDQWHRHLADAKARWPMDVPYDDRLIKPQWAIHLLWQMIGDRALVTVGVGQHQMWAMQHFHPAGPRSFISSSGFGTMGFGLPAAIGAKVACPDRLVVDIDGDGSLNMTIQELSTVHRYGLDIKIVVINNQYLGMVRQWQDMIYRRHRAESCLVDPNDDGTWPDHLRADRAYPDFVTIAAGYRIPARRVWQPQRLQQAYEQMLATDGPYLLDVLVCPETNVYPMIPAGGTYRDIILSKPEADGGTD